jgi:hypothetical protein
LKEAIVTLIYLFLIRRIVDQLDTRISVDCRSLSTFDWETEQRQGVTEDNENSAVTRIRYVG